jgi:hypothetical protein
VGRRAHQAMAGAAAFALIVAGFITSAVPAAAGTIIDTAAAALRQDRLYVAPGAEGPFGADEQEQIRQRLDQADTPIYIAILPDSVRQEVPGEDVNRVPYELRVATGEPGTYAAVVGTRFRAGSTEIGSEAGRIASTVAARHRTDPPTALLAFIDEVEVAASGEVPAADRSGGGGGFGSVPWLLLLIGVGGVALLARSQYRRKEQARAEAEDLARVRQTVDEDITAYGEQLDRLDPDLAALDEASREDFRRALDAYDLAKQRIAAARRPADVQGVSEALEDGRYALACVQARLDRRPLPERRPPCFFDPRHGPSVQDVEWAPQGGARRPVPVCAADAARIEDGLDPEARTVEVDGRRRPYWEAGPVYGPWAAGWYGAQAYLPALLLGTMLGSAMAPPIDASGWSGDSGGGGGDFGGGGGDFGGGGFGDFGGGGGDFGG